MLVSVMHVSEPGALLPSSLLIPMSGKDAVMAVSTLHFPKPGVPGASSLSVLMSYK